MMKVKKIISLVASAVMIGATISAGGVAAASAQNLQVPQLQIDKTKVVLPTIPEVNGVPLNIKADAATAVALVQDIYSKTVYSALKSFENSLVPVNANKQASNYVKDNDQIVTLETDGTIAPVFFGFVVYDSNGNPTGVDINGDGQADYSLVQDSNGNWYVDINGDGKADTGDLPVTLDGGLALRSNVSPNGAAADIDLSDHFYIAQLQIPFANSLNQLYDENGNPVDKVYFGIDFSKVKYIDPNATGLSAIEKAHLGEWELESGAVVIAYPLKYSPLKPSASDIVVPSQITLQDGSTINVLYYYAHYYPGNDPNTDYNLKLGETLTVGDWKIVVDDISVDGTTAKVDVTAPNGQETTEFVPIGPGQDMLLAWIDSNGDLKVELGSQLDEVQHLGQLFSQGTKDAITLTVDGKFIGIDNTQVAKVNVDSYQLKQTYKDGEKLAEIVPAFKNVPNADNWYLKINNSNPNEPIVEFVWKADYTGSGSYPAVFLEPGKSIMIPVPYFKEVQSQNNQEPEYNLVTQDIDFTLKASEGSNGYYDPTTAEFYVYYMKDLGQYYKAQQVNDDLELTMKEIQSYNPSAAIMTDQGLVASGFQPGYDYIIVGGWVSNAAWKLLEKYYPDKVKEMKSTLMGDIEQGKGGFVLKVLPNPADPNDVVIVAAGTDHEQTRAAVEALMTLLDNGQ